MTNIIRIQTYSSIMCGYFCTGFVDFMLSDYANLFAPNDFEKNDEIILKCFYLIKRLR